METRLRRVNPLCATIYTLWHGLIRAWFQKVFTVICLTGIQENVCRVGGTSWGGCGQIFCNVKITANTNPVQCCSHMHHRFLYFNPTYLQLCRLMWAMHSVHTIEKDSVLWIWSLQVVMWRLCPAPISTLCRAAHCKRSKHIHSTQVASLPLCLSRLVNRCSIHRIRLKEKTFSTSTLFFPATNPFSSHVT